MPYVLSHGKSPHGTDWINESAAECYLPLLHTLDRLLQRAIKPRWTVNLTPILGEQLRDESFKDEFEHYCQAKIDSAIEDQTRFHGDDQLMMKGLAAMWQRYYTNSLTQFRDRWNRDIVGAWRYFQDQGSIEVITCAATHGYLPLLGTDESVQAQVKIGVDAYARYFGNKPRGIWLPECAYRPEYVWKAPVGEGEVGWPRKGIESFLEENSIEYFFVDSHMIRGGQPLGTYAAQFPQLAELFARSSKFFNPPEEYRSEYEHYMLANGSACMARDPATTVKVWSGEHGYPGDAYYLEFHKQLYPGRLRYWRISEDKRDLGKKMPYDPWQAFERLAWHAEDLAQTLKGVLAQYRGQSDRNGTLVAMYDTELFGHWWWEGPEFLYELGLRLANEPEIECVSGGDLLDAEAPRGVIALPEGSWGEGGYHYVWLNDGNYWTWEKLYPAERKMRAMARNCANGPAREIVDQCARELLLAEASDWQFLISTYAARDYAEARFQDHIDRFSRLAAFAERVHTGGVLTEEETAFFNDCKLKDAAFQEINLSYWERLDRPLNERIAAAGT